MKLGNVSKSFESADISAAMLANINLFTRKELTADDVYIIPIVMCDNELDRDYDKFTVNALKGLAEKFIGKTVIFDHNRSTANQTARIFETELITTPSIKTFDGETLHQLTCKAYMLKNESTKEIIDNIDAGIIKEVSINCRVGSQRCNICGEEYYGGRCQHFKEKDYDGKTCFTYLDYAKDAYELSFVAVPAQPGAGVIKWYDGDDSVKKGSAKEFMTYDELKKYFADLGIDLDSIATEKGKIPELSVILEAVKGKLNEMDSAEKSGVFLTKEAVSAAVGKEMTPEEAINALKSSAGFEEKAKLYDEIKSRAVDEAIANGIRAKGDSFDENRYRKLFENSTIEEIKGWSSDFESEARKMLSPGRSSEENEKSVNTLAYGNLNDYKL